MAACIENGLKYEVLLDRGCGVHVPEVRSRRVGRATLSESMKWASSLIS